MRDIATVLARERFENPLALVTLIACPTLRNEVRDFQGRPKNEKKKRLTERTDKLQVIAILV